jgi:2-phosphosulfolactate phosphatase
LRKRQGAGTVGVHFLPELVPPEQLAGATAVVVDVLRATTTILQALQAGARDVVPCLEVEEARQIAADAPDGAILGGERGGRLIAGFDLGNSPAEYSRDTVGGRSVVMTTTNGTRALHRCRAASRVLLGAFVNLSCLVETLSRSASTSIVCAGTNGEITQEDVLLAGAVVDRLSGIWCGGTELNDEARLAVAAWQSIVDGDAGPERLVEAMRLSRGGRNLVQLGYDRDIEIAARIDSVPVIGELRLDVWRIIAVTGKTEPPGNGA